MAVLSSRHRWQPVRARRSVAGGLVVTLVASLLASLSSGVPAQSAPLASPTKPPAEKLDGDGHPVTGRAWKLPRVSSKPVPAPAWPTPGTTRIDFTPNASGARAATADKRGVRAGDLPVWVAPVSKSKTPSKISAVDVTVLDRAGLPAAWRDGLVLKVRAPQGSPSGSARVSVDYSGFAQAVGGEWKSRLRLWRVPECALTTPDKPSCRSISLPTANDATAGTVSADVPVEQSQPTDVTSTRMRLEGDALKGTGSFVVLAAAASGDSGDFSATSLAASSTWSAGGNSGDFSWSYPLRTPPATGPAPSITFAYSSASVDGRTQATNNQPSWLGEGFEYAPGYIERRYVPCSEDMKNGANNTVKTGDQCWRSDNATMSLNGRGGELIYESGKGWHSRAEDGSKIEKLTGAGNGDNNGEYWKVTTADGTQYFFGRHSLPGHASATNSTLTVPVFGNHTGEPCHQSSFAGSDCVQAWRWLLDYVVDVRGNTMSLWYAKETNKYARNMTDSDDVTYDRGGYLTRIDYGTYDRTSAQHQVTERSVTPYAQVVFDVGIRCFTDCGTEANPTTANWVDTPWDQECKASATSCPQQYSPTFWTTKRLKKVTTRVWDTTKVTPAWQDVESWTLTHTFSATADSTHAGLWLDRIDHAGLVGGTVTLPPVTFSAVSMPNRVWTAHGDTDNWMRISDIVTETGARIHVDYALAECNGTNTANLAAHTNTLRCYPVLVPDPNDPSGDTLITEWWHKHRVDHVAEYDVQLADGHQSLPKDTWYEYVGAPAWHYADDDGLSKPDRKTWSQWRGYSKVKTRVGQNPATQTLTVTSFLRGMHGDRLNPTGGTKSVTVSATVGSEVVHDEDQFSGQVREQVVYNGTEDKPVSKTVNVPWRSNPTASRTINLDTVEARFTDTQTTYDATALGVDGARGWRITATHQDFDHTYGAVNWSQEYGQVNADGSDVVGDEKCTTYAYNRNTAKNLTKLIKQTTVTALACGTSPTSVDHVISDSRVYYDGATSVDTQPLFGAVTKAEELKDWTSGTGTAWQTVSQSGYDYTGRAVSSTDIKGNTTTTAYTPAVGGPVTKVTTTGPTGFAWVNTVDKNPYWGSTVKATDPNGKITADVEYDPLGRVAKVWKLGWTKAAHPTKPSMRYTYGFAANRDVYPFVKTEALNADANYVTSYQIFDALLRHRQTQGIALDGSDAKVVVDTIYDEYGRAATTYVAHAEPGAPSGMLWWTPEWSVPAVSRTEFDRAGRATASVFLSGDGVTNLVEKWRSVTFHEGDMVKMTPAQGGVATTTVMDVQGRTKYLRQHTTAAGVAGAYHQTEYVYNGKDQLEKMVDPAGNEWVNEYDAKGRLRRVTDPDKGVTVSQYNDFDELEKTTDARGEVLWYVYDQIGRKKQLRDDSATGALRAEWKYDILYSGQAGYRGQLTQAIRYEPAGSTNAYKWQVRTFSGRYQPKGVNYVIPAVEAGLNQTYIYGYGYADATGEPVSISYPAAPGSTLGTEQITTDYDSGTGLPVRIDTSLGTTGTMATTSYTAYGERNGSIYKMPGGVYTQDVVYRDEDTRRISRTTIERESVAGTVSDRNYSYDHAGNILTIADTPQIGSADTQCFDYDHLNRLTSAWTPKAGVDCQSAPTVASLGGPQPYWQDWTFDATGNRLTETSHAALGDTTRTYTVPTGGQGIARPHAVTQMATAAPGQSAVTSNYEYDASGNTTCRPAAAAANVCGTNPQSQTLGWDAEGKLSTVKVDGTTTETNIYDTNGVRLIRRDATGTTLYLPGQEIRREGTVNTGTRYYSLAGTVCASRTGSSAISDLTWLYNDHQGTQQIAIKADTQTVTVRYQAPYGGNRPGANNPVWVNNRGFVGGDNDPTGLTNIGVRQYDNVLGRFISVDPVMDLSDPQQWHGYSYSNGNPITFSDPSGALLNTSSCGPDGIGCGIDGGYDNCQGSCSSDPDIFVKKRNGNIIVTNYMDGTYSLNGMILPEHGIDDIDAFVAAVSKAYDDPRYYEEDETHHLLYAMYAACWTGECWGEALGVITRSFQLANCAAESCGQMEVIIRENLGADEMFAQGMSMAGLAALGGLRPVKGTKYGDPCRSFSEDTGVLMADGTTKLISEIKIGDEVWATDPETGKQGPRKVTHLWVHQDQLVALETDAGEVITTEDHPFWNATDGQWQQSQDVDSGDLLLAASGGVVKVVGLDWTTAYTGSAYNLTIDDIHTYYVLAGSTPVLVHNDDPSFDTSRQARLDAMRQAGLPTSLQPRSATYYSAGYGQGGGYQYVYDYNGKTWVVTDNWNDLNADTKHGPHWEVGEAKPGGQRDSLGRLRVDSNKTKAFYGGGC